VIKFLSALLLSLNVSALSLEVKTLDDFDLKYFGDTAAVEIKRTEFIVKFVLYNSEEELDKVYQEKTGTKGSVVAFTEVHESMPTCFVHFIPAELWDDREKMTVLGHEIYHCALANHKDT